MPVNADDIRAAVAAGVITEAQAVRISALADARAGARQNLGGLDEPFELFRGFNEIFIVIGLVILFMGWSVVFGMSTGSALLSGNADGGLVPLAGTLGIWLLGRYFTLRRRMVAPSIALVVMFALTVFAGALSVAWSLGFNYTGRFAFGFGVTTAALAIHYAAFRVPITTAGIALGILATLASWLMASGSAFPPLSKALTLTGSGPFGWLVMGIGIAAFITALAIDMTDPHRVTRRASSAFWLHVVAAPAIVNTVAVTLLSGDTQRWGLLALFLAFMALLAIITDRRSFLVAGVGYIVAMLTVIMDNEYGLSILIFGIALVLLGAQWEAMRGAILRTLPDFPGKRRLPPYNRAEA